MDMKRYMKALPAVAALLLTAACSSNEDVETVETPQPAKERIIHIAAKVNNENATRATLDDHNYHNFETDDKLYVWGTNISGVLTMDSYGTTSSDFSGDLTYTGDEPTGTITLNAVVKGPSDQILGSFAEFKAREFVPSYTTGYASNIKDAVEKFSYFTTVGDCNFSIAEPFCDFDFLAQQSAFISFDITLEDGTTAGQTFTATINNGGSAVRSEDVTTVNESGAIKAQFTAAFPGGTITLSGAKVKLGDRDAISFASSNPTLYAQTNYKVTKSYGNYKMTVSATILGTPLSKDFEFKELSHEFSKTIEEMLNELSGMPLSITACSKSLGDDIIKITETAGVHKLRATGKGSCVYNVTISGTEIPVTFTVENS